MRFIIATYVLICTSSCITMIAPDMPEIKADTTFVKPRKDTVTKRPPKPPTPPADTGRAEIGFNPTVEDWESADTTNIEI